MIELVSQQDVEFIRSREYDRWIQVSFGDLRNLFIAYKNILFDLTEVEWESVYFSDFFQAISFRYRGYSFIIHVVDSCRYEFRVYDTFKNRNVMLLNFKFITNSILDRNVTLLKEWVNYLDT